MAAHVMLACYDGGAFKEDLQKVKESSSFGRRLSVKRRKLSASPVAASPCESEEGV